jgi:hypothetical protein
MKEEPQNDSKERPQDKARPESWKANPHWSWRGSRKGFKKGRPVSLLRKE